MVFVKQFIVETLKLSNCITLSYSGGRKRNKEMFLCGDTATWEEWEKSKRF